MTSGDEIVAVVACADCAEAGGFLQQYEDLSDAARHIAYGVEGGGWCCDHVEWTYEDVADAFRALWAQEVNRRDRLRAALGLIADHAVRVESSDEGTAYYVGVEAERGRSGCPDGQCWASSLGEAVDHWKAEVERLRDAIEEYALWEPGRAGHAEAHRKLLAAARGEA